MHESSTIAEPMIGPPEHRDAYKRISALLTEAHAIAAGLPHITSATGIDVCPIALTAAITLRENGTDQCQSASLVCAQGGQWAEQIAHQLARLPASLHRVAVMVSFQLMEDARMEAENKKAEN